MAGEMAPRYQPAEVEARWYRYWEQEGFFAADVTASAPTFSMAIPPPNVTGVLHIGHALNNTWQDILARYHRMRGDVTLWLPGTDHAGIATQAVVEKALREEGKSREQLGRDAFLQEVWAFRERHGHIILDQLRRLGCSLDWNRLRFTLDEGLARAVTEVFVRLYDEGLIYRGAYITNWCASCGTAISDIEVDYEDEAAHLWTVRYDLADGGSVTVATTRPETLLGDTALAVNPEDPRYRDIVGKEARVPLVQRTVPIVADHYVDPEYGTGVVKVTPAHDPNDFAIGERHHLPQISVIGFDRRMTAEAGAYQGLTLEEARAQVLEDLAAEARILGDEPITHRVGHCGRCGTVIEPLVSTQWFVKMQPLAEPALKAAEQGAVRFVPERFERVYRNWLTNIHDWCISRQQWWGHRIPAYYCDDCGTLMVRREPPEQCACGGRRIRQEEDVLDTWFSSALWPFSTLGWPEVTDDLRRFYPTSVVSTGYDILFFWVARMIIQGLHFTGEAPFSVVLLHGLIRDEKGRKMSKSAGNGIDPLEVIDRYGADALRMALIQGNTPGNDSRYSVERVENAQHLANKVWNAIRFVKMHLGEEPPPSSAPVRPADAWILEERDRTVQTVSDLLDNFEFGEAARAVVDFIWGQYCDWYIEMVKDRVEQPGADGDAARYILWSVAETGLKLLHPFMPFVTEELWQALPHEGLSIVVAPWPRADHPTETEVTRGHRGVQEAVRVIRTLRSELGLAPQDRVPVVILTDDAAVEAAMRSNEAEMRALARLSTVAVGRELAKPHPAIAGVATGSTLYVPLEGLVDLERERERLHRGLAEARAEEQRLQARLRDDRFRQRAPAHVVADTEGRVHDLKVRSERLQERLADLA
ncbi:MAG: valine--tRNA ligase [Clostridia bacterium]